MVSHDMYFSCCTKPILSVFTCVSFISYADSDKSSLARFPRSKYDVQAVSATEREDSGDDDDSDDDTNRKS